MDYAFYNTDPSTSLLGRAVQPFRRMLRRILRPYFYRLRDLLTHLDHRQQHLERRCDELSASLQSVDAAVRNRTESDRSPLQPQAFTADYLALTRRLAQLEDLIIDLQSRQAPAIPAATPPSPDFQSIVRRLEAIEEAVTQLSAASQLDTVLPLYSDNPRRQVS